ncbi:hypothetical protein [Parapedobacter pyrenivorans]|uniref:hypothetical protein n=1 Tax=Parapedobacter pyrenivorans TaxID=1305674 RepID=UPI00333FEBA9
MSFKFLELPNFAEEEGDLLTDTDKWMYEVAKLRKEELMAYESSLKAKWDTQNAFNSVRREAEEKAGFQFVKNLLFNTDFDDEKIAELASVSLSFVQKVKAELKVK